jgi:predicted RNA-binding Zn-ribbon protein involved in translation (DUF1610 family)
LSLAANTWLGWLVAWALTGAVVGAAIGWRRDRLLFGIGVGALLGPIGWILVARSRAAQLECPGCSRLISRTALVCPRCGANVRQAQARGPRAALRRVERGGRW